MRFPGRARGQGPGSGLGQRLAVPAVVAALAIALAGCGATSASLEELALEAPEYDGQEVSTYGVVAEFGEDEGAIERHFVLTDADDHRVRLLPDEAAEPHVGSPVQVSGAFQYDPQSGRALYVDTIEPAGGG